MWQQLLENVTAVGSGRPSDAASLVIFVAKVLREAHLAAGVVLGYAGWTPTPILGDGGGLLQHAALPSAGRLTGCRAARERMEGRGVDDRVQGAGRGNDIPLRAQMESVAAPPVASRRPGETDLPGLL